MATLAYCLQTEFNELYKGGSYIKEKQHPETLTLYLDLLIFIDFDYVVNCDDNTHHNIIQ